MTLLEEQRQQTPATTPEKPPAPTDPNVWQAKLREVFWNGLLDGDEKVLNYLSRLFNIALTEEIDLQLTPDEITLIKRLRRWQALPPDEQHRELEKNLEHVKLLPKWLAGWQWIPEIQAYRPRSQPYHCPNCQALLFDYETHANPPQPPAESVPTDTLSKTLESTAPNLPNLPVEAAQSDPLPTSGGTELGSSASADEVTFDSGADEITLDLTEPATAPAPEPATARPTHQPYSVRGRSL